ncbi:MAG: hypothetical protein LIO93_00395 [Bacteroidales bacterium]|nr:hypothetical protein [Bacteroidales bacterium]
MEEIIGYSISTLRYSLRNTTKPTRSDYGSLTHQEEIEANLSEEEKEEREMFKQEISRQDKVVEEAFNMYEYFK